mgnify:CR=1 FL=1
MLINKMGLHLQGHWETNIKDSQERFDPMMPEALALGCSWYTVLHPDLPLVPWIKERQPDAQIMIRDYDYDIMRHDPYVRAEDVARYMEPLITKGFTRNITVGNELNLSLEHNEWTPEATQYWKSREGYMKVGEWTAKNTYKLRELLPEAVVWFQAFATGHQEDGPDDNWYGYDYCQEAIRLSQGICIHAYWSQPQDLDSPEARMWYSHRWARPKGYKHSTDPGSVHAIFPDKWLFIKEHSSHPDTGNVVDFFNSLYGYPYVVGATAWLWRTPDPGHDAGRIQGRPLENILKAALKQRVELPDLSKPYKENEEEPPMPNYFFTLGFKDKANLLGPEIVGEPLENERYDAAGDAEQYTTKGRMEWVKKLNKTYFWDEAQPKNL